MTDTLQKKQTIAGPRRFSLTLACILFVTGLSVFQLMPLLPDIRWIALIGCFIAIFWFRKDYFPIFFCIGICWAWVHGYAALATRVPPELEGKTLSVVASILTIPQCNQKACRFDALIHQPTQSTLIESESINTSDLTGVERFNMPRRVKLSWYSPAQTLKAGQNWLLKVRLKRPHGMMNPGGFDYEQWLFVHHIDATGYVRCKADCQLLIDNQSFGLVFLNGKLQQLRQGLYLKLSQYLADSPVSGLIAGMTVGIRDGISTRQWDILRDTGTAHLMAISGLHVGLVAGLCFWLVRNLASYIGIKRCSPHQVAAIVAMTSAICYALLAGLSLPTQRALIMLSIIFGSVILQTKIRALHLLALTAVVVVASNPLAVLSAGFWLSFGAVAVISLMLTGRYQTPGYWFATWSVGWRVALGLSPLLLLFFGRVSIIAPIANLIAVPVVSILVVPVALFGIVVSSLSEHLAVVVFGFSSAILSALMWYLEQLSQFKFSTLAVSKPSLWVVMLSLAGVILLLLPKGVHGRWLGLMMLLPVLFPYDPNLEYGTVKVTVLDVGQGLSTVIETAQHTLVFDTGIRLSPKFDMGSSVLVPYLNTRGISQIDMLVLSHTDADHIGGSNALLSAMAVSRVVSSYPDLVPGSANEYCQSGNQWQWDGVKFEVLAPLQPYFNDENNNSCVIKVIAGNDSILLTGDIESEAEQNLVKEYGSRLQSQILIVPHHGSKTSSSSAFLDVVKPVLAIIPAGYRNQYGFPHHRVLKRYRSNNIRFLTTADSGAISITLGGPDSLQSVTEFRGQSMRYWN